jgi:hypothetical protein
MAELSSDQLGDIQGDLGIADDEAVFTDAELHRLYTRADSSYDLAVVYALDQLLMDAAKFNDYKAGSSSESKSQVFKHLQGMRKLWSQKAGIGYGAISAGVIDLDFMEKGD